MGADRPDHVWREMAARTINVHMNMTALFLIFVVMAMKQTRSKAALTYTRSISVFTQKTQWEPLLGWRDHENVSGMRKDEDEGRRSR